MKPTKILSLVIAAASAAIATYLLIRLAVASGFQVPVANLNLILVLPIIGLIVLGMTWPIIRYRRAISDLAKATAAGNPGVKRPKRVDPFYAVRLLLLAKASSISGALFIGWHLGAVAIQAGLPVITESIWLNFSALIGSLIMTACAVVAEFICRIRQSGDVDLAAGESGKASSTEANPA
jgi:hypothetical protein